MQERKPNKPDSYPSRRDFIRTTLGLAGGLALPAGFAARAFAADNPAIGTYPAGSTGDSVFIGIAVPPTRSRAKTSSRVISSLSSTSTPAMR